VIQLSQMPSNPKSSQQSSNYFTQVLPEHPHRRLHVLLAILAVAVVAGSIWVYRVSIQNGDEQQVSLPATYPTSAEELRLIAEKISSGLSESPPTQVELEKMATKLNKENNGLNILSANDLELQAQILNK